MISDLQEKLLEILAPSAFAIAGIFFAVLVFLFGAIGAVPGEHDRTQLRNGIIVTYIFTLVSVCLSFISMIALRYHTVVSYQITILLTGLTMLGMFCVATWMLLKSRKGS